MVERSYLCNLCRETFKPDDARLIGLTWQGDGGGNYFVYAPVRNVENHLCVRCILCVIKLGAEAEKHGHKL